MKIDTSLHNDIVPEKRKSLYCGKYKYCLQFRLVGSRKAMYVDHIGDYISSLEYYMDNNEGYYRSSRDRNAEKYIRGINLHKIEKFLDLKLRYLVEVPKKQRAISISFAYWSEIVKVYSNDPKHFEPFVGAEFDNVSITSAEVTGSKGVLYFKKEPKHRYRIYFKYKRMDEQSIDYFIHSLDNIEDITPSRSLQWWMDNMKDNRKLTASRAYFQWLRGTHSIDFDDESIYTLLSLYFDSTVLGKYYELKKQE